MWKTIFAVEWVLMRRDRGILSSVLLFGVLVVVAAQVGSSQMSRLENGFEELNERRAEARALTKKKLRQAIKDNQPMMNNDPRDPLFMGQDGAAALVILPLGDLGVMAVGQRAQVPQAMRVSMGVH